MNTTLTALHTFDTWFSLEESTAVLIDIWKKIRNSTISTKRNTSKALRLTVIRTFNYWITCQQVHSHAELMQLVTTMYKFVLVRLLNVAMSAMTKYTWFVSVGSFFWERSLFVHNHGNNVNNSESSDRCQCLSAQNCRLLRPQLHRSSARSPQWLAHRCPAQSRSLPHSCSQRATLYLQDFTPQSNAQKNIQTSKLYAQPLTES